MTVGTREPQLNPQTQTELEPLPIYSLYVNCLFVCLLSLAPLSVARFWPAPISRVSVWIC